MTARSTYPVDASIHAEAVEAAGPLARSQPLLAALSGAHTSPRVRYRMPTVSVEEVVDVGREALFAVLTDHESYGRFRGVQSCTLIRDGKPERNGLGAIRRVHLGGPAVLDEEIVVFEAPAVYEYRVIRARPFPVKHTLGRVELEALDAHRTKVVWTSTFEFPLPIFGRPIGKRVAAQMTRGFRATIRKAARLAVEQAA